MALIAPGIITDREKKTDQHSLHSVSSALSSGEEDIVTNTPVSASLSKEYPLSIYNDSWEGWLFVVVSSIASFMSAVSVPIYFPILDSLANQFDTSLSKINVTATVYSIFQGVSPIWWATISDTWGRRPVYFCCALIYVAANVCLATCKSYGELVGLRILQAFGGASTLSLIGGVIGDISTKRNRGALMGTAMGISQLSNCFGPLAGSGIASQFGSWRAVFWALAIFGGIVVIMVYFLLPETNRHIVGTGSRAPLRNLIYISSRSPYARIRHVATGLPKYPNDEGYEDEWILPQRNIAWFRWAHLFVQLRVLMVLIPTALHYTTWYMVLTAQSTLLANTPYNFSVKKIGLTYLSSGAGSIGCTMVTGRLMQYSFRRQARYSPINIYKARLEFAFCASTLEVLATLVFGWCMDKQTSFYPPVVMTFFVSVGGAFFLSTSSAILVDLFPGDSAASQSCNNLARCLVCAAGLAAVQSMMDNITIGGTFTLMATLCLASNACIWFLIWHYGPKRENQVLVTQTNNNEKQ